MRYTYEVGGYNTRRFSRPWIAVVEAWPVGAQPTLRFGAPLDPYLCEIEAEPGAILRYGQRDNRGNHTVNNWAIALPNGKKLRSDARDCREHWLKGCPVIEPEAEPEAPDGDNVVPFKSAEG